MKGKSRVKNMWAGTGALAIAAGIVWDAGNHKNMNAAQMQAMAHAVILSSVVILLGILIVWLHLWL